MKKNNTMRLLFLFIIGFSFANVYGQADENTYIINRYFQNISNGQEQLLTSQSLFQQSLTNTDAVNAAELNILQSGNYNAINVETSGNRLNISQVGENNSYEFITYYGRGDSNFEVQQLGNNNFIQVLGENSIIDNMKILQKSNNQTITVINY
ncbi:hypothetical protein [Lutibacter sp.]